MERIQREDMHCPTRYAVKTEIARTDGRLGVLIAFMTPDGTFAFFMPMEAAAALGLTILDTCDDVR